jgi:hypothetical protein
MPGRRYLHCGQRRFFTIRRNRPRFSLKFVMFVQHVLEAAIRVDSRAT